MCKDPYRNVASIDVDVHYKFSKVARKLVQVVYVVWKRNVECFVIRHSAVKVGLRAAAEQRL
ncbi:unnamed protein product, partial [marine sediment metagenome]